MPILYYKPRKDLEYSCVLAPQKIDVLNKKQYRFIIEKLGERSWLESHGNNLSDPRFNIFTLNGNFELVETEKEAVEDFR